MMLILDRRIDQAITIRVPEGFSGDIHVMVTQINHKVSGSCKLGIQAPKEIRVLRTELEEHDMEVPK